jgi:hypothetical protein
MKSVFIKLDVQQRMSNLNLRNRMKFISSTYIKGYRTKCKHYYTSAGNFNITFLLIFLGWVWLF